MEITLRTNLKILLIFFSLSSFSQDREHILINNEISEDLLKIVESKKIFVDEIEKKIENIIDHFENIGFPFVQVKLDNFINQSADLIINKGAKYSIDSLVIYGNTNISEKQLYNILGMKKGSVYNQSKIEEIDNLLNQAPYINQSKKHEFVFHKNTVDIYFYLEKNKNNSIDGLIGFQSVNNKIQINGFAKIQLENTINQLEKVNIAWIAEQEKFQKLESEISLPYFIHHKIKSQLKLNILKQTNDFTNIISELGLNYKISPTSFINISYQNKISITEENLPLKNEIFIDSRHHNIGAGLQYNNEIIKININGYFGKRNLTNTDQLHSTINSNNYFLEIQTHNLLLKNKHIKPSFSTYSSIFFNQNLYANELSFFGGSNTLKGFDENEFLATKYSIATADLSCLIEKNTSLSLFFQQCYFEQKIINKEEIFGWPKSFGAILNLSNKSNIIYLQYAIGISKNQSFNLKNAKVHIGIKNIF